MAWTAPSTTISNLSGGFMHVQQISLRTDTMEDGMELYQLEQELLALKQEELDLLSDVILQEEQKKESEVDEEQTQFSSDIDCMLLKADVLLVKHEQQQQQQQQQHQQQNQQQQSLPEGWIESIDHHGTVYYGTNLMDLCLLFFSLGTATLLHILRVAVTPGCLLGTYLHAFSRNMSTCTQIVLCTFYARSVIDS
jgi:hypothetical protein